MLEQNEEFGLNIIHNIINHATDLWKKIEEPVIYGPDLRRISNSRTPIPQIIEIEGKQFEIWGDDIVYKWPIHLAPTLIMSALQALEGWIIRQIQQNKIEPIELINKILSNTKSFAIVSVCSRAILHILFSDNFNNPKIIESLIFSLIPIIEHPIFWILHSIITSEEYLYYRKQTPRFENIIEIILFYHTNLEITKKIIPMIESFSKKIPFIFEEEKIDTRIILDREESINFIIAKTKKENYNPSHVENYIFMRFEPPKDLINKKQMQYQEYFLKIQSYKGTIFNALDNKGIIKNYSIHELFKIIKDYFDIYDFYSDYNRTKRYFNKLFFNIYINSGGSPCLISPLFLISLLHQGKSFNILYAISNSLSMQ